jgi:hypothetical protein
MLSFSALLIFMIGKAKKGKTQREMDRWSKTVHDKPWTERRGY